MAVTNNNFDAAVTAWCRKSEDRMERVFRESCQRLVNEVQANVPVVTGFLKSSPVATEGSPTLIRKDAKGEKGNTYTFNLGQPVTVIASLKIGQVFFFCYVAVYARAVEYGGPNRAGRGYVRLAAQMWKSIVAQVAREAQSRAGQ